VIIHKGKQRKEEDDHDHDVHEGEVNPTTGYGRVVRSSKAQQIRTRHNKDRGRDR